MAGEEAPKHVHCWNKVWKRLRHKKHREADSAAPEEPDAPEEASEANAPPPAQESNTQQDTPATARQSPVEDGEGPKGDVTEKEEHLPEEHEETQSNKFVQVDDNERPLSLFMQRGIIDAKKGEQQANSDSDEVSEGERDEYQITGSAIDENLPDVVVSGATSIEEAQENAEPAELEHIPTPAHEDSLEAPQFQVAPIATSIDDVTEEGMVDIDQSSQEASGSHLSKEHPEDHGHSPSIVAGAAAVGGVRTLAAVGNDTMTNEMHHRDQLEENGSQDIHEDSHESRPEEPVSANYYKAREPNKEVRTESPGEEQHYEETQNQGHIDEEESGSVTEGSAHQEESPIRASKPEEHKSPEHNIHPEEAHKEAHDDAEAVQEASNIEENDDEQRGITHEPETVADAETISHEQDANKERFEEKDNQETSLQDILQEGPPETANSVQDEAESTDRSQEPKMVDESQANEDEQYSTAEKPASEISEAGIENATGAAAMTDVEHHEEGEYQLTEPLPVESQNVTPKDSEEFADAIEGRLGDVTEEKPATLNSMEENHLLEKYYGETSPVNAETQEAEKFTGQSTPSESHQHDATHNNGDSLKENTEELEATKYEPKASEDHHEVRSNTGHETTAVGAASSQREDEHREAGAAKEQPHEEELTASEEQGTIKKEDDATETHIVPEVESEVSPEKPTDPYEDPTTEKVESNSAQDPEAPNSDTKESEKAKRRRSFLQHIFKRNK